MEVDEDSPFLSARHVFLGGGEVLDLFAKRWPKLAPKERLELAGEIGAIAGDRASAISRAMSAKTRRRPK